MVADVSKRARVGGLAPRSVGLLRAAATAALLGLSTGAFAADDFEYLRGYFDALLDSRFAGLGLQVKTIARDGTATLAARACLGPAQRRDIERAQELAESL